MKNEMVEKITLEAGDIVYLVDTTKQTYTMRVLEASDFEEPLVEDSDGTFGNAYLRNELLEFTRGYSYLAGITWAHQQTSLAYYRGYKELEPIYSVNYDYLIFLKEKDAEKYVNQLKRASLIIQLRREAYDEARDQLFEKHEREIEELRDKLFAEKWNASNLD